MKYAIIGFGQIGQALAKAFARKGIEVSVATTRAPEAFAADAAAIGPAIVPTTLAEAAKAKIIFLAVRFESHPDVARSLPSWHGRTIVDVTNTYGVPPGELGGRSSSEVIAHAFAGGRLVRGFNHLVAGLLGQDPAVHGGRRVVFLASDDDQAAAEVGALAEDLGFSPVQLGGIERRLGVVGKAGRVDLQSGPVGEHRRRGGAAQPMPAAQEQHAPRRHPASAR